MTEAELLDPRTWGETDAVTLRETHVSWVALVGNRAYKVKKAIKLPFLDFRSREHRRAACLEEVRLNRRLAPDTYLGVRALVAADGRLRLADVDAPEAVDYVVEMRRFDEGATLASRLADGAVTVADVELVARHVAAFHATAPARRAPGATEAFKRSLDDGFASLMALDGQDRRRVARLERAAASFFARHWDELEQRARDGLVRDGHGDLRLEHVVLGRPLQIVDCIEFDEQLRYVDVARDIAFLAMELEQAGRSDLADAFVRAYAAAGGDPADPPLLAFFVMSRALVRATVALLRQEQLCATQPVARELLAVAERAGWRARGRLALVVCGPAAAGKSTLAAALARESGWRVVSSDAVRKRRAGLTLHDRGATELYDQAHDRATYTELISQATAELACGGVIVDATFRDGQQREAIVAAMARAGARLCAVECRLPAVELESRARAREDDPTRVSDATATVALSQLRAWRPWDETAAVVVRTDRPLADQLAAVADGADLLTSAATSAANAPTASQSV